MALGENAQQFLLAVDPSLTSSGWALFSLSNGKPLCAGLLCAPGTTFPLSVRLEVLQREVESTLDKLGLSRGDIAICEGPAPIVLNPRTAMKVERVRGIFETVARARGVIVPGRINPRTVQTELLQMRGPQVSRKEVKLCARQTVERLFGEDLSAIPLIGSEEQLRKKLSQDIIDALLIGCVAVSRIQLAIKTQHGLEAAFESRSGARRGGNRQRTSGWTEKDFRKLVGS